MSVAFDIKYPWRGPKSKLFPKGYRSNFITIWHVDPEIDGSDDSCGWSRPRLSKKEREVIDALAWHEAHEPIFFQLDAKRNTDPVLCQNLLFGAFMTISQAMTNRRVWKRPVKVVEALRWSAEGAYNSADNFSASLCFKSGYHSNWYRDGVPNTEKEDQFWREEQGKGFFSAIATWVRRERRWWFQKPRWHVWHWRIKVEPLMTFKRWAFSRCAGCKGRFAWGYSPVSGQWDSEGPRWFRGESSVFHSECHGGSKPAS